MGARAVPLWVTPRMAEYLSTNGPWSRLVTGRNVDLRPMDTGEPVMLAPDLTVTPFTVPHRDETLMLQTDFEDGRVGVRQMWSRAGGAGRSVANAT